MVALSDRKIAIVKTLVESAPDTIVGGLQRALAQSGGDTVLASVRDLVEAEAHDRMVRNAVFQPVVPLFVGDGSDRHGLVFPARALAMIWRGLKAAAPQEMAAAVKATADVTAAMAAEQRPPDPYKSYDALTKVAVQALRAGEPRDFRAASELCDQARPGGAETLAACLDIAHVVRRTLPRLALWVAHPDEQTGAAARLAYKDSVAVAVDAGPRFFEMLACQIAPSWMVLRIISAVMDKPTERYLADSELGGFPERVMGEIDESLKAIGKLDLDAGPKAGREAARLVELITHQITELEACIELTRDHGWGHRIVSQRKALAGVVEGRLRDAEKLATAALPMQSSGFGRARKNAPRLDEAPDPQAKTRILTLLTFTQEIRLCANYGGFSAMHAKVIEKLGGAIDHYVDDVLEDVRNGDIADVGIARAHLQIAAAMIGLLRDDKAADLVRRRTGATCAAADNSVTLDA